MQCTNCNTQYPDGTYNCPNCGAPAGNQMGIQGQIYGGGYATQMTKKEFLRHPSMKKCKVNIGTAAGLFYFSAIITSIVNVLIGNIFGLVDVALILGFGLGIHLAQSRICAILMFLYAAFNTIYTAISTGRPGGYLLVIAAISGVVGTFQFHKAWKAYQNTGILPETK